MTDPIQALADAARELVEHLHHGDQSSPLFGLTVGKLSIKLRDALAAYDAAQVPTDAEIEAALTAVEGAAYDHGLAVAQGFDDTRPLLEKRDEACEVARQLMRRARPEPATGDAQLETLIDALCEAAYAVGDAPDYEVAAEAELAAQRALVDWVGKRIAAAERDRDGLLRAAKEAMRLGMCADALDILRAEVARVEGKP